MLQKKENLGPWIYSTKNEDKAAEEKEKHVASTSYDDFGPLMRVIRSFNRDILDHIKIVMETEDFEEGTLWSHYRVVKEARETVDKLFKSAGSMVNLFGDKGWSIEDDVVSFGIGRCTQPVMLGPGKALVPNFKIKRARFLSLFTNPIFFGAKQ